MIMAPLLMERNVLDCAEIHRSGRTAPGVRCGGYTIMTHETAGVK